MVRKTAMEIFKDIHNDEIDPEIKLMAIQEVLDMETHYSITKADLLEALRWLVEDYI
ncbi:MAG TPA: hypothetical protein IAB23_12695 [Candidatus Scybalocola faecavium]|nr:hypothetical protein [Candidatus Scybalocola faecavium]